MTDLFVMNEEVKVQDEEPAREHPAVAPANNVAVTNVFEISPPKPRARLHAARKFHANTNASDFALPDSPTPATEKKTPTSPKASASVLQQNAWPVQKGTQDDASATTGDFSFGKMSDSDGKPTTFTAGGFTFRRVDVTSSPKIATATSVGLGFGTDGLLPITDFGEANVGDATLHNGAGANADFDADGVPTPQRVSFLMSYLTDLGYDLDLGMQAIDASNGNLEEAVQYCIDHSNK
jgi:hypothetical protein